MPAIIQPTTPGGFPEYLPEYQLEFERIKSIISDTYARHGFTPLDTPDLEKTEILLAKGGGETDKQVYMVADKPLSMRFDLTVPLARYAAQHQSALTFPFKRFHIGKAHRGERSQAGRFHEFYQCDIDTIGTTSPLADAEIPAIINEVFTALNFGPFLIRINDRRILTGLFATIGIPESLITPTLRALDKIEKMPESEFLDYLREVGLQSDQIDKLMSFTKISGTNAEILDQFAARNTSSNPTFTAGLDSLRLVIQTVAALGVPETNIKIDPVITRGLDYYTGTVYETLLLNHPDLGSVCSGGRYDNLAENYTETKLPGVGISIGLSRLFYSLKENGIIKPAGKSPAQVVVLPMSDTQFAYAAEVATALRTAGIPTMLYTESVKFPKKLSYADKMGFAHAIILGESEQTEKTASLKDMNTGDNRTIPLSDLPNALK